MITESSKALLQRYLQEDVDENLLNYVATNASGHSILYMSLEQFCTKAGIDEEQAREALRLAANKLPIKCKFVTKQETGGEMS